MAMPGFDSKGLRSLFSVSDLMVAALLIVIIALMLVPLPPFLLDMLLTMNIAFSLIILLVAMYLKEPLEFASFPSILLIVTVLRLALNIASSRLLLTNAYAGQVVGAFGTFVVGGNYIVGVIIFAIITIVQFVVITKGSERVAEVAARFTLDAMPGKQMSIDADLNAGLIAQITALLIAIATGLVITKSSSEMSLGTDVASQLFAQPRAFAFVSIILGSFAMIPGLPTFPFLFMATASGIAALLLLRAQQAKEESKVVTEEVSAKDVLKKPESILGTLGLDPLSLKAGRNIIPLIDPSQKGPLLERITLVRYNIGQELGFVIPGVRVMDDLSLPPNQYVIDIRGTKVSQGEIQMGHHLIDMSISQAKAKKIPALDGRNPVNNDPISWVPDDSLPVLQKLNIPAKPPVEVISEQ